MTPRGQVSHSVQVQSGWSDYLLWVSILCTSSSAVLAPGSCLWSRVRKSLDRTHGPLGDQCCHRSCLISNIPAPGAQDQSKKVLIIENLKWLMGYFLDIPGIGSNQMLLKHPPAPPIWGPEPDAASAGVHSTSPNTPGRACWLLGVWFP